MSSALDSCWEETDQPVNRRPGQRRVATMGKVGRSWVELPKVVGQMLIMPGFWLCGLLMTLFLALYVLIPALLLDYLPGRLFGYYQGTRRLDAALAVTLLAIAGLVIWGKIDCRLEQRRVARRKKELWRNNGLLQAQVLAKLSEKGRLHPETGHAYKALGKNLEALGEREQARQAYQQGREIFRETLGAAHPEAKAI